MQAEIIRQFIEEQGEPAYKAQQALDAFFQHGAADFSEVTTWSKDLREKAAEKLQVLSITEHKVLKSSSKRAYKAAMKTHDGNIIETVLLNPKDGLWSTCISSQVGCAMACTFCATGKMGLVRNLTAEEITDQVLFWIQFIRKEGLDARLSNIVFMGMGEPMANIIEVEKAIEAFVDEKQFNLASRHISVSTSGIIPGILRLAKKFPQVNLALSLHVANNEERTAMMPVNKAYNIEKLIEALKQYFELTNRKVFLEYILLKDENDSRRHANELIDFIKQVGYPHLLHVNLIVYNKTTSKHEETPRDHAQEFKQWLAEAGYHATIRKNLGRDIQGACGQLAGEEKEKED